MNGSASRAGNGKVVLDGRNLLAYGVAYAPQTHVFFQGCRICDQKNLP